MVIKERDREYCDEHSGQCELIDMVKERQEEILKSLPKFVSSKMAWGFFIVFLGVASGIVGFLWHGQVSITTRLDQGLRETLTAIHTLETNVKIIDYKVEKHLDDTDELRKKIEKKVDRP